MQDDTIRDGEGDGDSEGILSGGSSFNEQKADSTH
jgi:hypothetical protein